MRVLVVDTSSAAILAAVLELAPAGDRVVGLAHETDGRGHSERLAGLVEQATAGALGSVEAIVAGLGPGPFTGLRVGLVSAAAWADALGIPAYGVCSLDGYAGASAGRLLVATDARRREVYWATYVAGRRVDGPNVDRPADVPAAGVEAMTGAGARLYADLLRRPLLDLDAPDPLVLAAAARDRVLSRAPGELLEPMYLRRPDAVPPAALTPPGP